MRSCGDLKVFIYDVTMRDGAQTEGISFTVQDKLKIAEKLDGLGIPYIEGGWPGSNPKDLEFFRKACHLPLKSSRIAAFGATRKVGAPVAEDSGMRSLLEAETPVVTVFGKTWDLHIETALQTTLGENLRMIKDSVAYLKSHKREVVYDAEHFFDGFKANPAYALETLKVAAEAGADWVVLCDTNGGSMPHEVGEIAAQVIRTIRVPVGIHPHNDAELAVANALTAVRSGVRQVQGTVNGFGERCGNANICSVIPNLQLKEGYLCLPPENLARLTEVAHYIGEVANMAVPGSQPFVGHSAFAHKGGVHVSAVLKNTSTYEHIAPESVGNQRRVLVSELAGSSNLFYKARELGIDLGQDKMKAQAIIKKIKDLEYEGYQFEGADASLELLFKRAFGQYKELFVLEGLKILVEKRANDGIENSEAMIKIRVGDQVIHTAAEGNGPVNALDNALRKALEGFYPQLKEMHLIDYKVRVLYGKDGTGSKVRVLIESADAAGSWCTVGVSESIIEASWQALADSMSYTLQKGDRQVQACL